MGYDGAAPQQRVELLMSEYFRRVRPVARALAGFARGRWSRRRPTRRSFVGSAGISRSPSTASASSIPRASRRCRRCGSKRSEWRSPNDCGVSEQARTCIEENVDALHGGRLRRNGRRPAAGAQPVRAAAGPVPSSLRDARLRAPVLHIPGVRPDSLPRWSATSTIATRSTSTRCWRSATSSRSDRSPRIPGASASATMLSEVHAPELLTLSLLYHDVGKWRDGRSRRRERASRAADAGAAAAVARGAADGDLPDPTAPGDVPRGVPARLRGSGGRLARSPALVRTEEQLKMLCLLTLADIGAVSPETLTPWKEELLWRLYVDTYNRLTFGYADELIQTDHAGLEVVVAGTPGRHLRAGALGVPRRPAAPLPGAVRSGDGLPPRAARTRHPSRRDPRVAREARRHLGAVGGDARQAVPLLEHLRRAVLLRHGHPSRPGDDDARAASSSTSSSSRTTSSSSPRTRPAPRKSTRSCRPSSPATLDVTTLLRGKTRSVHLPAPPAVRARRSAFDNEHSQKYTVLEIVADDADRAAAPHQRGRCRATGAICDLALISTEGKKAIDVLHVTKQREQAVGRRTRPRWGRSWKACWRERMKLIKSIVRPNKVDEVREALERLNIAGMTVTDVRGHGRQKGHTAVYRGKEYAVSLLPKVEIEVVVSNDVVEEVIQAIIRRRADRRNRRRTGVRAAGGRRLQHPDRRAGRHVTPCTSGVTGVRRMTTLRQRVMLIAVVTVHRDDAYRSW